MTTKRIRPFVCIALSSLLVWSCGRGTSSEDTKGTPVATVPSGGLVSPLKDDSSNDIVSWVDGKVVSDWSAEIAKRERAIDGYLSDTDDVRAAKYGFRTGQNPQLGWSWFRDYPVGFNGVPFVLFKTILDLDPNDPDPTLQRIARIWKHESSIPLGTGQSATRWTFDHLGVGPTPFDYVDGIAKPVGERTSPLPFGFAFENPRTFEPLSETDMKLRDGQLRLKSVFQNTSLLLAKLKTVDHEDNWEKDRPGFGSPGSMDRVFFSCAACHVGRVVVGGRMKFLVGMPNTEIEAQYYSKLLMLTSAALVESGFDPSSPTPVNPAAIKPNRNAVRALYAAMLKKALNRPETMYGSSPAQIARAKIQTLAVADEFPSVMQDLIATGVKTHFIYYVVAKNNAYKRPLPDVLEDRPGQMDAFGIASGLVAIHTRRPDNSFMQFVGTRQPEESALHRLLEGERPAGGYARFDGTCHRSKSGRRSHREEHPGLGTARAGAGRRQERQLGGRAVPRQLGREPGSVVAHARVRRVGDRRSAHGQRAHSRAAQPVHRQSAAAAVSLHERRSQPRA